MEYQNIHKVYFIGIGGIGMSGLARFFNKLGATVSGYDKMRTGLTEKLNEEGISVHHEDNIEYVPDDADLYVYTPAIPAEQQEFLWLIENGYEVWKRSEVLGMLSKHFKTIAVAGTHGKTTISSMITHLFRYAGIPVNAFIGGIAKNTNSNFVFHEQASILIVEADEYDRSFLNLNPEIAIVSAIDEDHLDVYGSGDHLRSAFTEFFGKLKEGGKVFINSAVKTKIPTHLNVKIYGTEVGTDIRADNIQSNPGQMVFNVNLTQETFYLNVPGIYNVENALASLAVAHQAGIGAKEIKEGLKSYTGVKRRFDIRVKNENTVYVDDYAHHPNELKACIQAAADFFPGRKLTGIFQPHLYSRTRDFADGFAKSLMLLDEIILLDIYPAREKPIPGVTSELIAEKISGRKVIIMSKEGVTGYIARSGPELLLTLGAGDIDQLVEPLTKKLEAL